eukprot:GHVL01022879.1.p1 GENE.GHVL01022879.1~~GHVL01022879.1.p1  ORF type:complete len:217 (-),score=30.83 GHVL01022879.1:84-734(-)
MKNCLQTQMMNYLIIAMCILALAKGKSKASTILQREPLNERGGELSDISITLSNNQQLSDGSTIKSSDLSAPPSIHINLQNAVDKSILQPSDFLSLALVNEDGYKLHDKQFLLWLVTNISMENNSADIKNGNSTGITVVPYMKPGIINKQGSDENLKFIVFYHKEGIDANLPIVGGIQNFNGSKRPHIDRHQFNINEFKRLYEVTSLRDLQFLLRK